MADEKEFDASKLFNDVSKAMQDDDGDNKLSELLAVETPEEEQPDEVLPDEDQPDDTEVKEEKEDSPLEGGDEPDDSSPDNKADKPEEKEPTAEQKRITELEEQLAAAKRAEQALRSQAGRVPSIQRKLDALDKKLESMKSASPSSQTSTKIKPKVDKLLEGVRDTDPVLADNIASAIAAAIEGVDEEMRTNTTETLSMLREQEANDYVEEQKERLLSMYPNAPQVFASPHWSEWKKSQPEHVLALAGSTSADAVAMAFDLYRKDMEAKYPELATTTPDKKETPPSDPAAVKKAEQLEQERLRKKKDAVNLDSSKSSARVKEPNDPNALFNKFFAEVTAEISGK